MAALKWEASGAEKEEGEENQEATSPFCSVHETPVGI